MDYLGFERNSDSNEINYYKSFEQLEQSEMGYDVYVCGSDQIWNPL